MKERATMHVKITSDHSSVAGFISWKRLATETFHGASELKNNERITHFEVSERGLNYFVATGPESNGDRA
jgi:hypothetical protein